MAPIQYRVTDVGEIALIRELWNELNAYHRERAGVFREYYNQTSFDNRKEYFEKLAANGLFRLILASDREDGLIIGYIVSSLSAEQTGEIESVFVTGRYRGMGVGSVLVTMALAWLDEHGSVRNRVSVADGNEEALDFYRKFDFYPRMTVLEQKKI